MSTAGGVARLAAAAAVALVAPLAWHLLVVAHGAIPLAVSPGCWLATAVCAIALARACGAGAPGIALAIAAVASVWITTRGTPLGVHVAPVATWLLLSLVFARTLRAGREPLVSRIARLCHGEALSPDMARYTRRVTVAWSAFLGAVATGLAVAALALPLETWSLAASVGAPPLAAVMFAAEYAIRVRRFPDFEHVGPIAMARRLGRAGWQLASAGK